MKPFSLSFLIILLLLSSCRKNTDSVPACIEAKISEFSQNSCEHDAEVKEYIFQGKNVFAFSMGFCGGDLGADVLDNNCNTLGSLGGFTGNTVINGEEFSKATYVRTIWSR